VEADVMSHGNRRMVSNVGLINQRYVVNLVGNWQMIQVFSNQERIDVSVPFKWDPNTWYRLKTRVDVAADGTGVVRAKAWKKSDPEPAAWTIEVPHKNAHKQGAPGIYGFSPQNRFAVFVDNVSVTPNK
jgi:outer membrane protein assembly factor BamB